MQSITPLSSDYTDRAALPSWLLPLVLTIVLFLLMILTAYFLAGVNVVTSTDRSQQRLHQQFLVIPRITYEKEPLIESSDALITKPERQANRAAGEGTGRKRSEQQFRPEKRTETSIEARCKKIIARLEAI